MMVAPTSKTISFAKVLNRSDIGSMNDLIYHATMWMIEKELLPFVVGLTLNDIPMSALDYANPREAFDKLAG